jgi:hypothetical protein
MKLVQWKKELHELVAATAAVIAAVIAAATAAADIAAVMVVVETAGKSIH